MPFPPKTGAEYCLLRLISNSSHSFLQNSKTLWMLTLAILTKWSKQSKCRLKYFANFNNIDKSTLANLLEEKLIPLYQHEKMVLFWLLILLFRFNFELIQKDNIQKLTFQVLEFYDRQYRASTTNA